MRTLPFGSFLPALALLGCAPDDRAPVTAQTFADADVIVTGTVPAGVDVREHFDRVPEGGFGVIVDPITGDVAVLSRAASPFARVASGEFTELSASCQDCGTVCDDFSPPTRTVAVALRQDSGPNGRTYRMNPTTARNFSGLTYQPATWPSAAGADVSLSTTGTVSTCAPFSYYFDVVDVDGELPVEVPACTSPPCTGVQVSGSGNSEPRGVWADASGVYWANRGSSTIRRANLDGTGITDFATGIPALSLVYGDETHIYAPEYAGSGRVHRIRKSDGAVDVMVTGLASDLHGIDFIDGSFYFTTASISGANGSQLYRYTPGDASASVVATGLRSRMFGIAHDPGSSTTFLVSNGGSVGANGVVETTPSPPTAPLSPTTAVTGLSYPIQSQVHGSYLYVANANDGRILRIPLGGSTLETVAQCPAAATQGYGVSVYDGVAYYTCFSTNELRAVGL